MSDYQLINNFDGTQYDGIKRTSDGATIPPDEGNRDWLDYMEWRSEGNEPDPVEVPSLPVPDSPTLSDWRVGLMLWGRLDDLLARVAAEVAKGSIYGRMADERVNYANNVFRSQLVQLKDVFGFTEAEVDESLWRADRVRQGDLSGKWPLTATAKAR